MKLFYFCDHSFLDMKDNFEKSFKDKFELNFKYLEKVNLNRNQPGSGIDIWKYKTEMIIEAIKNNYNNVIVISDIDIIFYKPVIPTIEEYMVDKEICFQKEKIHGGINIGFMSILCNDNTLNFWNSVYSILCNSNYWDQQIVNDLIYKKKYNIKWNLFPHSIWTYSQGSFNKEIILHHANCISTKEGKYKQMEIISNYMNS